MERFLYDARPEIFAALIERDGAYCRGTRRDGAPCMRPLCTLKPCDIHIHHKVPIRPVRESEREEYDPLDVSIMVIMCRSCHQIATIAEQKARAAAKMSSTGNKGSSTGNDGKVAGDNDNHCIVPDPVCVRENEPMNADANAAVRAGADVGVPEPDHEPERGSDHAADFVDKCVRACEPDNGNRHGHGHGHAADSAGSAAGADAGAPSGRAHGHGNGYSSNRDKRIHKGKGYDGQKRAAETPAQRANRKREWRFVEFVYDLMWTGQSFETKDIVNAGANAIGGSPVAYDRYMAKLTNPINGHFIELQIDGTEVLHFRNDDAKHESQERYAAGKCVFCKSDRNMGKVMCDNCIARYGED